MPTMRKTEPYSEQELVLTIKEILMTYIFELQQTVYLLNHIYFSRELNDRVIND